MPLLATLVTVFASTVHGVSDDALSSRMAPAATTPPGSASVSLQGGARPAPLPANSPDGGERGAAVPEPATLLLVGTGLVGLAMSSRRWRRALPPAN